MIPSKPQVVLTIAGTDPSGGAGIQADLKTFCSLQCYGASVTTALVAQNTMGVQEVHAPPTAFVEKQLQSVLDDLAVDALKTGMLFNGDIVSAVVNTLKSYYPETMPPLVVDPVCVSTSGHSLLEPEALSILREKLIPIATVITPNKSEAEKLLSRDKITSVLDMLSAAKALSSLGPKAVLLKGGHIITSVSEILAITSPRITIEWMYDCPNTPTSILILQSARRHELSSLSQNMNISQSELVLDVLYQASLPDTYTLFVRPRIESKNTHGTGCTLSAALACGLAGGKTVLDATRAAAQYTHLAIASAYPLGNGHGPLNHLHNLIERKVPHPSLSNPYPFISAMIHGSRDIWDQYVKHPFVRALGEGTLPKENFIHFIKQDYRYLKYYGRAHGLMAAKSLSFDTMQACARTLQTIIHETRSQAGLSQAYGVSVEELENTPESRATTAYGAYLIDIGLQGDVDMLLVAVAACLLGYGEVGLWLKDEAKKEKKIHLEGNPYKRWIEEYAGSDYQEAVRFGIQAVEERLSKNTPSPARFEEMRTVWERCTRLEIGFWDMALGLE